MVRDSVDEPWGFSVVRACVDEVWIVGSCGQMVQHVRDSIGNRGRNHQDKVLGILYFS